jgi:predicted hydrocarbon binding protein
LKESPKRDFLFHYAKGKKLFQIIVHISDSPGSLAEVQKVLGAKVNLLGTTSYTLSDGTAMFNAFAEALSVEETPERLVGALRKVKSTIEADVREGKGGLLVDTFHRGIVIGKDDYILLRSDGLGEMFDRIVQLFSSGGEVLLYEEGKAMGEDNAEEVSAQLGDEVVRTNAAYLAHQLTAQGWGATVSDTRPGSRTITITVEDCFECRGGSKGRQKCDFLRGYFEGTARVTREARLACEEIECRLTGGKSCVFRISYS